jgi:hypothetical protein
VQSAGEPRIVTHNERMENGNGLNRGIMTEYVITYVEWRREN